MQAAFGEGLKVVGSSGAIGAWEISAAPDMRWTDGNVWALDLNLPQQAGFEYKLVHVHCNGTSWEGLPEQARDLHASCLTHVAWEMSR